MPVIIGVGLYMQIRFMAKNIKLEWLIVKYFLFEFRKEKKWFQNVGCT
jgi:hypothetical protein